MSSYFGVLPSDLLLDLSLYLNYRDTILACDFLKCTKADLWLHKIRKELNYSNEFIQEYIYDNGVKKTLLPINEKYLELKARKGVDFGCEFYQFQYADVLIVRASRLSDFNLATTLVTYFLSIKRDVQERYYADAIQGSTAVGNLELADKLIRDYGQKTQNFIMAIISGIYETYPNGNSDLLKHFNFSIGPGIDSCDLAR